MIRRLARWLQPARAPKAEGAPLLEELAGCGLGFAAWLAQRRSARRLYCELEPQAVAGLRLRHAAQAASTRRRAEDYRAHRFDLLGSGPFVPVDPDRPRDTDGYQPIDWYLDPVRDLRFPRGVPYKEWDLYRMRPGNADVKYPWEMARCQHWATLGQAFMISGDPRFAQEILRQAADFTDANPVGIGVNWTCTMDVALRAANWAIGLALIKDAPLPAADWERAYAALFAHGAFIRDNLEDKYEVTSNHFLSNVVGLLFLGQVFADLPSGRSWSQFARQALEREIDVQVLPDGADFESSIPYHRLVLELFLGALRLADHAGAPLSAHYRERVHAMARFLWATLRPDGRLPQVGDADDGRLHILTVADAPCPQDARHLIAPAALVFGETTWLAGLSAAELWEAAWWGLTADPAAPPGAELAPSAALFRDAGIAVLRDRGTFLLISNGPVGTKGFGNHKHNDQLSFEFHAGGVAWIVDPGSHVYTGDPESRNRLRATAAHNTLQVDDLEQNEFKAEWLFRMFDPGTPPVHTRWQVEPSQAIYVGRHGGYRRLSRPVWHERQFRLLRGPDALLVTDRLIGARQARAAWTFQCGPQVRVTHQDRDTAWLEAGGKRLALSSLDGLDLRVESGAYSPSYGVLEPAPRIRFAADAGFHDDEWRFLLAPADWLADPANARLIAGLIAGGSEGEIG